VSGRAARVLAAASAAGAVAGLLAACSLQVPGTRDTFRILAGSEIEDLEPLLADAGDEIGADIEVEYTGTLEGAERIASGAAEGEFQAAWFSSNRYLDLLPDSSARVGAADQVMASPVILGVRESVATDLGWDAAAPSWGEVAQAAAAGDLTFAMTNPAASNTGFSALIGVATALSGTGAALTESDVAAVSGDLADFFSGQTLTAGSSGWLSEAYVERQREPGREVDALVNYESVLLSLNAGGDLAEPLTLVYPSDGVVTADYPLTELSGGSEEGRERYDRLVDWLREPAQQRRIVESTNRRPAVPGVDQPPGIGDDVLVDLPFPNQLSVATGLVDAYLNEIRRPPQTVFVLDTSGSMGDDGRIEGLRGALGDLAGADTSTQGSFARFRNRETVTLIPFSSGPEQPELFRVPATGGDDVLGDISARADGLEAFGDTAIYDSLELAYEVAAQRLAEDPETYVSIVLMTDGENTAGRSLDDFRASYEALDDDVRAVPTFTVLFGDSNVEEMTAVADLTGGRVFDAREGDLSRAFQEIRGYQ